MAFPCAFLSTPNYQPSTSLITPVRDLPRRISHEDFQICVATPPLRRTEARLTLRGGTENNLAHVNIGRLLNREHDSVGDRVGRELARRLGNSS
jgi:hypothetical protein